MFLLFIAFCLALFLVLRRCSPAKPFRPGVRTGTKKSTSAKRRSAQPQSRVSRDTEDLLYRMCAGDRQLAHRLVYLEYADTEELRWKRAIYRLERDRS